MMFGLVAAENIVDLRYGCNQIKRMDEEDTEFLQ